MEYVPKKINFNEKTDSQKLNDEFKNIYENIKHIQLQQAELNQKINQLEEDSESLNYFNTQDINSLTDIIESIVNSKERISIYDEESILFPTALTDQEKCKYDTLYGTVTLNILNSKELFVTTDINTGNRQLINDIDYLINRKSIISKISETKIDSIEENELSYMFLDDREKVYKSIFKTFDESINFVDLSFEISTKNSINHEINYIKLEPTPNRNLTLEYIKYDNSSINNNYFHNGIALQDYDTKIDKLKPTTLSITPTEINKFKFQLTQPNKYNTNPYIFNIGVRRLQLLYNTYFTHSYIGFKIKKPNNISKVTNLITNLDNNNIFELKVYKELDNFNEMNNSYIYKTGDLLDSDNPIYVNDLSYFYILVKLTKPDDIEMTPELKYIDIEWS